MSDKLAGYLKALINSDKHGGRTIQTDESTVVLYDCGHWSDAHSEALCDAFPCAEVSIMQCLGSLSGFIVVVRTKRDASAFVWVLTLVAGAALLLATCRHVFWSA